MIRATVRENGTARRVRLEVSRAELGTDPAAGIRLEGAGIAGRHCLLRGLRRGFEVVDLRSREGTILNGTRVSRATVAVGDTLVLGSASVVLDELTFESRPPRPVVGAPLPPAPEVPALRPRAEAPGSPAFDESLYRAVRGSPPLIASLLVHGAACAAVLFLTPPAPEAGLPDPTLRLADAPMLAPMDEKGEEPEQALPGMPALSDRTTPVDFPELVDEPDRKRTELDRPPDYLPMDSSDGEFPADLRIGFAGSGFRAPPRAGTVEFEGNPSIDGQNAEGVNRAAAGKVVRSLGGEARGERDLLKLLDPRQILVVQGTYDRVEGVFGLLGLRHDNLTAAEIPFAPLDPDGILVIDCGTDLLDRDGARKVREFVEAGGFLCTTDWGLENVLEPAFPTMLRSLYRHGKGVSTQNEVVEFRLTAPGHPLVRGIRGVAEDSHWWVEDRAHPIEVLDRRRVTVLAESPEFRTRYGSGVLAATFDWGKGRVLHLLGHAWQKQGNLKGAYGIQRMLVNFLIERASSLPEKEESDEVPASAGSAEKPRVR